jgi:hypothetical protein
MKRLQIVPRATAPASRRSDRGGAVIRKQAEIREHGRGTSMRASGHQACRSLDACPLQKRSFKLRPGMEDGIGVEVKSPQPGDDARHFSSLVRWSGILATGRSIQ